MITPALVLLFWFVYRLSATWTFSADALCYMLDVEFGGPRNLLHPFHMAYSLLGRILYLVAQLSGYQGRAIFLMQAVNAFLGAAALGIFYRTARSRFGPWPSTVASVALGFSFAFWTEIIDPGCYALAALATCALLVLLVNNSKKSPLQIGALHGLAILVHLMLVMAVPAFLYSIAQGMRKSRKVMGQYLIGVSLVVGPAYGGMALYVGSLHEFLSWFLQAAWKPKTSFLTQNYFHWNLIENLVMSARDFRNSLVLFPGSWPAWITALSSVIAAAFLAGVVAGSAWIYRQKNRGYRIIVLWAWVLGLSVFQFFYAGGARFRILWLPAFFWLALEVGQTPFLRKPWKTMAGLVPLMVFANFQSGIRPHTKPEASPSLLRSLWIEHHLTPKDFLLFRGREPESITNFYANYFAHDIPARSLAGFYFDHSNEGLPALEDLLKEQESAGRRLVFEELFWKAEEQKRISETIQVPWPEVSRWMAQWRPVARIVAPDGYALVAVTRQAK